MAKATKIDAATWTYRGFTVHKNYTSPRGTGQICSTQQGYRMTPAGDYGSGSGIVGSWFPTLGAATDHADMLHARYEAGSLRPAMAAVVEDAKRIACQSGEPVACPDAHQCRHGIDS